MKKVLILICAFMTINSYAQTNSINRMEAALKTATTASDFNTLIDGNVVAGICSMLTGKAVCDLLIPTPLNQNEEKELEDIKSKLAFEQFLIEKGISPNDFYMKLWEQRNSETFQSQLDFLKK